MVALSDVSTSKNRHLSRHIGQEKYIHWASTLAGCAFEDVRQNSQG